MIVTVLLAAHLAVAPPPTERTPNLYQPRANCDPIAQEVVARQLEQMKKLGRLPNAAKQYAVLRQMDGCPVPAPMGYHPPALPGAADAPAMRGDGPSNRR